MGQDVKVIENVSELGSKEEKDLRKEDGRKMEERKERKEKERGKEKRKEGRKRWRDILVSVWKQPTSHSLSQRCEEVFSVVLVILEKLLKLVFCISFLKCLQNVPPLDGLPPEVCCLLVLKGRHWIQGVSGCFLWRP